MHCTLSLCCEDDRIVELREQPEESPFCQPPRAKVSSSTSLGSWGQPRSRRPIAPRAACRNSQAEPSGGQWAQVLSTLGGRPSVYV